MTFFPRIFATLFFTVSAVACVDTETGNRAASRKVEASEIKSMGLGSEPQTLATVTSGDASLYASPKNILYSRSDSEQPAPKPFALSAMELRQHDDEFANAVEKYQQSNWSHAYGRFMALAERGDSDAARIALFMHRYGPALYNNHWDAAPHELELWSSLSNQVGRTPPAFQPINYADIKKQKPKNAPHHARQKKPSLIASAP